MVEKNLWYAVCSPGGWGEECMDWRIKVEKKEGGGSVLYAVLDGWALKGEKGGGEEERKEKGGGREGERGGKEGSVGWDRPWAWEEEMWSEARTDCDWNLDLWWGRGRKICACVLGGEDERAKMSSTKESILGSTLVPLVPQSTS